MQAETGTSLSDAAELGRAGASRRRCLVVWALVAAGAVALDQITKWLALQHLTEGVPRDVVGRWLRFDLTANAGAAFSLGTSYTILLTVVAIGVIVVCVRFAGRLGSMLWAVTLGLLLGGALGNVTDRMVRSPGPFRGHVVDFLQLPHWPVFNVADACICVAGALFVVLTARGVRLDGSSPHRVVGSDQP